MKRILAIFLMCVLLYQSGGFALHYLVQEAEPTVSNGETLYINIPITLPYQTDWEVPKEVSGEIRKGDRFYQMKEQKVEHGQLITTLVEDQNARDRFLQLASQFNEHLSDEPLSVPLKTKLINILVKEYCTYLGSWVFYIIEWPVKRVLHDHVVLSTINFESDPYSPPKKA